MFVYVCVWRVYTVSVYMVYLCDLCVPVVFICVVCVGYGYTFS